MSKQALLSGDQILCKGPLGKAILLGPAPQPITGSGHKLKVRGKAVAVKDNIREGWVLWFYIAPPYLIPGTIRLKADKETTKQLSTKLKLGGMQVLLFHASGIVGNVETPASMLNPLTMQLEFDSTHEYKAADIAQPFASPGKLFTV
ncbi:hypothetical protein BUE93_20625 [Chromobacterium amazonense]|uniref:Uncharacterized protein n=1 Tax=Chromobacterium amazonense TaxID=1382803 RepID=A0A2S9WZ53_9NEIS|nr:hypothetical protein [Chromobacterium amazonense]PRP68752.1 hypothetical protein BUE93_20625 [Chromobacterium amazonense]